MELTEYTYLYVEDDQLSRDVMRMIMETGMGIDSLTIFESSDNFANRLRALEPKPDIILLDIHVPPLDGFQMLRLIREQPGYEDARVIALTASVMNEEIEELRTGGFDGAIGKPLSIQTFPDLIQRVIDGEKVWHVA